MDAYIDLEECKNAKTIYYDYIQYKNTYGVLDSWNDIEKKIINTYTAIKKSKNNSINSDLPKFYKQSKNAIKNSLYYMYHKFGACFYIRIRNNKLILFNYIWNNNFNNRLSKYLIIDPKYANKYTKQNKNKWKISGAMIRVFDKKYEGYAIDFYYSETKYLLQKICSNFDIADCDFIVFGKDTLAIKKDLTEPYEEVVGDIKYKLTNDLKFKEYCPICSFDWNERYADIPLPTPDDIRRIFQLYVAPSCQNLYPHLPEISWNDKKPIAVFRGSYTGSSAKIKINPRLHISYLSTIWENDPKFNMKILDAGLSSKGGYLRGRKEINDKYIRFVDNNYWPYLLKNRLTHEEQTHYKYIIYIEGNVSAYRGAYLFSFGSVVLWVKSSKYHLWFESLLKDKNNCIMIENDLSDLVDKIKWLINNDNIAQQIAINGLKLYKEHLCKESILEYTANTINKIANC